MKFFDPKVKKRFDLYDLHSFDLPESLTLFPFAEEYNLACPVIGRAETVSYYGITSWGDIAHIHILLRPFSPDKNTSFVRARVEMNLHFSKNQPGSYYVCEEEILDMAKFVDPMSNIIKYRVGSFVFEQLRPFVTTRIVFRGFLTEKIQNRKIFTNIHFLVSSMGKIFDNSADFDVNFMKKQFKGKRIECEDSFEQWTQIRGNIQSEEDSLPEDVYFWGMTRKSFEQQESFQMNHFFAWNKNGMGIHLMKQPNSSIISGHVNVGLGLNTAINEIPKEFNIDETMENVESLNEFEFNVELKKEFKNYDIVLDSREKFIQLNDNLWAFPIKIKNHDGFGLFWKESFQLPELLQNPRTSMIPIEKKLSEKALILSLDDEEARIETSTGGKGSSLAILNALSEDLKTFKVPSAIVVTAEAYLEFLKSDKKLKQIVEKFSSRIVHCKGKIEEIKGVCEEIQKVVKQSSLPKILAEGLKSKITQTFGKNCFDDSKFAVRSSAVGEDSEEMSAAGQMTTFLGVSGFDSICSSVVACWASQFSETAVEYKRGYGQELNSPMAVVIQKMVASEVAGVMFTCSPLDGNQRFVSISASYGLGESVVSGKVEPDTYTVKVDVESSPRKIIGVEKVEIGAKKMAIHMNETLTKDQQVAESEQTSRCLNDEQVLQLARIGLEVADHYGNARDIEFGLNNGVWYLLQSRPVTNLESLTEWEIMHELDHGHNSEHDVFTRANVGEVFAGATSYLSMDFMLRLWVVTTFERMNSWSGQPISTFNPHWMFNFTVYSNIIFIPLTSAIGLMSRKTPEDENSFIRGMEYGFFGHRQDCKERFKDILEKIAPLPSGAKIAKILLSINKSVTSAHKKNKKAYKIYGDYSIDMNKDMSSKELFELFKNEVVKTPLAYTNHMRVTNASMFYNSMLHVFIESKITKDDQKCLELFSKITSSVNDVFSAQVPARLKIIASKISDVDGFLSLSDEESLKYLQQNCEEFNDFIKEYGHRGYKEFDMYALQWEEDPTSLIHSLKSILKSKNNHDDEEKIDEDKNKDLVENICETYSLGMFPKMILSKYLIPKVRRGIRNRELGKNLIIRTNHQFRKLFYRLGEVLVEEGKIPQKELIFFMTLTELNLLVNFSPPNPLTILNSKNRLRLHDKKNSLKWNEETIGYEMKPRDSEMKVNISDSDMKLTGVPISSGKIVARCCVAETLEEAKNIQKGDILITYSTDIGWSPYFAALGGLVTEIGGLVSHGAVIAREYGLPCLVGVDKATLHFRTGDLLLLDTTKGFIAKVDSKNNENQNVQI